MNNLVELTELIIKNLVNDSDSVSVKEFESDEENIVLIEVMVSSEDMPRVIGHGGKTINSLKTALYRYKIQHDIPVKKYKTRKKEE